jgi:hypothetical protein
VRHRRALLGSSAGVWGAKAPRSLLEQMTHDASGAEAAPTEDRLADVLEPQLRPAIDHMAGGAERTDE